jgi:hypothetical protein
MRRKKTYIFSRDQIFVLHQEGIYDFEINDLTYTIKKYIKTIFYC